LHNISFEIARYVGLKPEEFLINKDEPTDIDEGLVYKSDKKEWVYLNNSESSP